MLAVAAMLPAETVCARDTQRIGLAGIDKFRVVVEELDGDAEQVGITEGAIRTHVELRLRQSGLPVTAEQLPQFLYVRVSVVSLDGGSLGAYFVATEFNRLLRIPIKQIPGARMLATTWNSGSRGGGRVGSIAERVRSTLDLHLDEFCNDFLAANADFGPRGSSRLRVSGAAN
jgi:hypothetical protein